MKNSETNPDNKPWYIYILKCSYKYLYTGISPNVRERVLKHRSKKGARFTKNKYPIELVYVEKSCNLSSALKREREIKKSGREKKEKLIETFQENIINSKNNEIFEILSINSINH